MRRLLLGLAFAASLLCILAMVLWVRGWCPPVKPTIAEVTKWAAESLPVGSSEGDVAKFCGDRGFVYFSEGPDRGQANRRNGGCEYQKSVIIIDVEYDANHRVKSVKVSGATLSL